jgi:ATP-dependent Zn protease
LAALYPEKCTAEGLTSDDDDQRLVEIALHEAGHAVISRLVGLPSGTATLCDHDGVARSYVQDDGGTKSALVALAGRAATEVILGTDGGCGLDDAKAINLLNGNSYARGSLLAQARELIRQHCAAVERVAHVLLDRGTLSGAEIDRLMVDGSFNPTAI